MSGSLHNVTLELSGKAFFDDSDAELLRVARTMYRDWRPLVERADVLSVMLWIADGSEILEYAGNPDDAFEWNCYQGVANANPNRPAEPTERMKRHIHYFPHKYRADAEVRSYSWLRRLTATLRSVAAECFPGKPVRIGATFDNGPEFAVSDFKFRRHREIARGNSLYANSFVTCTARLHADERRYAGFPGGIPEGTSLGTFLGRQFRCFSSDLVFDYLWLSNGMGFGLETWNISGALFDREQFFPEKAPAAAAELLEFWRDLRRELPGTVLETRGSNFSAGVEMATDGCPLPAIYRESGIVPPVNSPWAALNGNTGIELAAWMSHIAGAPGSRIPFRFYIHDPWFLNSPWLERYGREPWDIYLPLSVGRLNGAGKLESCDSISLLSVDDSHGRMPEQVPLEVLPHLLNAIRNAPDQTAPFLWLYPFEEYDCKAGCVPAAIFNEEWYLAGMIQNGLPLNTVIGSGDFRQLPPEQTASSLLFVPVSGVTEETFAALLRVLDRGGSVIFYGSLGTAIPELLNLLELENAAPVTGRVTVSDTLIADQLRNSAFSDTLEVIEPYHAGGLTESPAPGGQLEIPAFARQGEHLRVLAGYRRLESGGFVAFLRALLPTSSVQNPQSQLVDLEPPSAAWPAFRAAAGILERFGWKFRAGFFMPDQAPPRINLSRSRNAFFYSVFAPDTTVELRLDTPWGAPLLHERECIVDAEGALLHPPKSMHAECRAFVRQKQPSAAGCKIGRPGHAGYTARLYYFGLVKADLVFFPPPEAEEHLEITDNTLGPEDLQGGRLLEPEWIDSPHGRHLLIRNFTGRIHFSW